MVLWLRTFAALAEAPAPHGAIPVPGFEHLLLTSRDTRHTCVHKYTCRRYSYT